MLEQERYAAVSCHVEHVLDDRTWRLFSRLQERMPHGFRIAALLRPPDDAAGEDAGLWLERAHEAAARGPLGHHTHWRGAAGARPRDADPAERVRREAAWLREAGLAPTLFCGGGWYMDAAVAGAVAEQGYADCTATAFHPRHLDSAAPRLALSAPCWVEVPDGRHLLELPTTHSIGMAARAALHLHSLREPLVHVYFHDSDLLDRRRSLAFSAGLALLAARRRPVDLDRLAAEARRGELPVKRPYAQ